VDDFYAARDSTIPTLPWPSIAPPITCGERKVWHWAHKAIRHCDHWWESETEWHRGWKDRFPAEWQEIIHTADDGERHIADVKSEHGLVIEFQHSAIKPEERRSREAFYKPMAWVVNGLRRSRDQKKFESLLREGRGINLSPLEMLLTPEGALLADWLESPFPVFFDFGRPELWLLRPNAQNLPVVIAVEAASFLEWAHGRQKLMGLGAQQVIKMIGSDGESLVDPWQLAPIRKNRPATSNFRQPGRFAFRGPGRRL
jgi:hypothetical protein